MAFELWAAFALAALIVVIIPGPTVLLVSAYALGEGRRTALWTVLGVALGDLVAITASVLGLGALLLASATLFTALKLIGAVYLIWLGWKLWRSDAAFSTGPAPPARKGRQMALHAFAVTATNPKGLVFFIAFLPQFLDSAAPLAPQFTAMIVTFTLIGALNAAAYALAAGALRRRLAAPGVARWFNRGGGAALMAMGLATAFARRV